MEIPTQSTQHINTNLWILGGNEKQLPQWPNIRRLKQKWQSEKPTIEIPCKLNK